MSLSIIIPTYNRANYLARLLEDLAEVVCTSGSDVEIVVLDNCSTDGTADIVERFSAYSGLVLVHRRHATNIGMEANIVGAMLAGNKKYSWLLSDHQTICKPGLANALAQIEMLDFDFGHARLLQWSTIMPPGSILTWAELTERQRGQFVFTLGNMSALMYRTALRDSVIPEIYKSTVFAYPHVAIFGALQQNSRLVEFEPLSALPGNSGPQKVVHAYDVLIARYSGNLRCVRRAFGRNNLPFAERYFFTREYRKALLGDVLNQLFVEAEGRAGTARKLLRIAPDNPFALRIVVMAVAAIIALVPTRLRLALASRAKARWKRKILA